MGRTLEILSSGAGWHVRDLLRAAGELGISVRRCEWNALERRLPELNANSSPILVRTMPLGSLEQVIFRMDTLHERELAGIRILNSPRCLETCIDKYLTLVKLHRAGLRVPRTHVGQTVEQAMAAFADLGGDTVLKPIFGSEGRGILRLSDPDLAWRTFKTLERSQAVIYQQAFISHPGYDLRAFVLDGKLLAAMKRTSHDDWRTNCARGAVAESVQLTSRQLELAQRAAEAVGAWAVGVDLLPGPDGVDFVIEVNAVPGWRSMAPACGVDVARELLKAIPL